jgi:hypothetical protein
MNVAYINSPDLSFFSDAKVQLEQIITQLESIHYASCEHGEIEQFIKKEGDEVLRCLFQGYLDQKADDELRQPLVTSAAGEILNHVKEKTTRKLTTLFGDVTVTRIRYNQRHQASQFPLDAELNLANDQYSDGVRHRVAREALRGSYDDVVETIKETTGCQVAKRQCLNLAQDVAQDFENYYQQNQYWKPENTTDLLVITGDGKGIVMLPDSLRECTQKAALKSKKLNSRLSQGEKKDRKRMAQVMSVYTVLPHIRTPESIMKVHDDENDKVRQFRAPARNKRVWASVERDAGTVIEEAFEEALRRDPEQKRRWVVLVDGLPSQLKLIDKISQRLEVKVTVVMDFIHVLEYLWKAAWCFYDKGDSAVEKWVAKRAVKILHGEGHQVAKGIRISATKQELTKRENVDKCASYLLKNKSRLKYGEALAAGFPIASGVIEGACRHLINDRLDITGARWGLQGAESILKLRSLKSSGDFEGYWAFHKQQSKLRLHSDFQFGGVSE